MIKSGHELFQGLFTVMLLMAATSALGDIANTKHNLSSTGPGSYTATTELQICLVCHAPHNTSPADPLWNHELSGQTYTTYDSDTLVTAAPGQPTGRSKLCLSCHDGTVAVGSVHNLAKASGGGAGTIPGLEATLTGDVVLGTDLSDDHPVSFTYDDTLAANNGELIAATALDADIRLENGELQCTSCHDPHVEDLGDNPKFLRRGYTDGAGDGSPLCRECHNKTGWAASKHATSQAYWDGTGTNPFHLPGHMTANDAVDSTMKANGCEACHKPHDAPSGNERLLKYDTASEDVSDLCMRCHNGNVSDPADPTYDMSVPFGYTYNHMSLDAAYDGRHTPIRDPDYVVREGAYGDTPNTLGDSRHAECVDCHNPHQAQAGVSPNMDDPIDASYPNQGSSGGTSMDASPVIKGVWGVEPGWASAPADADWGTASDTVLTWPGTYSDTYTEVDDVQYQYQLCLKCHSYYAYGPTPPQDPWGEFDWLNHGKYASGWDGSQTDQSMEFNPNNTSYHPVAAIGKNTFIKQGGSHVGQDYSMSLLGNLSADSTMSCTDCHSNENYVAAGLAKGPHGSNTWPNIWAPYSGMTGTRSRTGGNTFDTDICFKCHRADSYGNSGCSESHEEETGYSTSSMNLHCYHVNGEDIPCQGCHSAIPHGWKNKAFLIWGDGSNPTAAPYNSHGHYRYGGSYRYGLNSSIDVNSEQSGNWRQSTCHNYSMACD